MKDSQSFQKKKKLFKKKANKPASLSTPVKQEAKSKKLPRDLALLLIPLTLFLIFITLYVINDRLEKDIARQQLVSFPIQTQIHPYPIVEDVQLLPLSAESALIVDRDSQVVLFAKNPQLRFSMASTVKIMTALTALEHYSMNDIFSIKTIQTDGSVL